MPRCKQSLKQKHAPRGTGLSIIQTIKYFNGQKKKTLYDHMASVIY